MNEIFVKRVFSVSCDGTIRIVSRYKLGCVFGDAYMYYMFNLYFVVLLADISSLVILTFRQMFDFSFDLWRPINFNNNQDESRI